MSLSTRAARFLLDENVRAEIDQFLRDGGFDVRRLSKGAPDRSLLAASKEEQRVIVTNDEDFAFVPVDKAYAVVLLRVPQRDVPHLLAAFGQLLAECRAWESRLIVLDVNGWCSSALAQKPGRRKLAA